MKNEDLIKITCKEATSILDLHQFLDAVERIYIVLSKSINLLQTFGVKDSLKILSLDLTPTGTIQLKGNSGTIGIFLTIYHAAKTHRSSVNKYTFRKLRPFGITLSDSECEELYVDVMEITSYQHLSIELEPVKEYDMAAG